MTPNPLDKIIGELPEYIAVGKVNDIVVDLPKLRKALLQFLKESFEATAVEDIREQFDVQWKWRRYCRRARQESIEMSALHRSVGNKEIAHKLLEISLQWSVLEHKP